MFTRTKNGNSSKSKEVSVCFTIIHFTVMLFVVYFRYKYIDFTTSADSDGFHFKMVLYFIFSKFNLTVER